MAENKLMLLKLVTQEQAESNTGVRGAKEDSPVTLGLGPKMNIGTRLSGHPLVISVIEQAL